MLTVAVELSKALVAGRNGDEFTLLCSRERPAALTNLDCDAVFAPYRHEVILKTRWLPAIESQVGCDAILYPYWPSPPRRRPEAPPAAVYVHDLAFRPPGLGLWGHPAPNPGGARCSIPGPRRRADPRGAVRIRVGPRFSEPLRGVRSAPPRGDGPRSAGCDRQLGRPSRAGRRHRHRGRCTGRGLDRARAGDAAQRPGAEDEAGG